MAIAMHTDPASAVLTLLDAAGDDFVTGAELGARLGISRAGVWKRIEALRGSGYDIEAKPRLGYRLSSAPDILTAPRVQQGLATRLVGGNIHHVLETETTMTLAGRLAAEGAPDGTVVVAERQTAGRGRLGRQWATAPGRGIWMTLILRPQLTPMELGPLTLLLAVGVADGLRASTSLTPQIKWPNDVLIKGRKVCGILTELVAEQDAVRYVLAGVGINVLQARDEFPADIRTMATSLTLEAGAPVDRVAVFRAVLEAVDEVYHSALGSGFAPVLDRWRDASVTLGSRVRVASTNDQFSGTALDITEQGALIVRRDDGRTVTVVSGDVTLVKD